MMDLLWSVGGFLVAIGVLVAFHEFGHYWVARRCGVRVLRFSIGFGKPIWTHRAADGVEWSVSAIPLGGYVKMLDGREGDVPPEQAHLAFNNQTVGKRALIVAAGPAFNFVLAAAFYWLIFVIGVQGMKPLIAAPPAGSVAAVSGLQAGETVQRVAGVETPTWQVLHTEMIDLALDRQAVALDVLATDGSDRKSVV